MSDQFFRMPATGFRWTHMVPGPGGDLATDMVCGLGDVARPGDPRPGNEVEGGCTFLFLAWPFCLPGRWVCILASATDCHWRWVDDYVRAFGRLDAMRAAGETFCPKCGKRLQRPVSATGKAKTPRRDDVSVCMHCGVLLVFENDRDVRVATRIEERALLADRRMGPTLRGIQRLAEHVARKGR